MQLFVYISPQHPATRHLEPALRSLGTHVTCRHLHTFDTLIACLRRPLGDESICILAPSSPDELRTMINHRHLMRDLRTILVLPAGDRRMRAESHLLRPRFTSRETNGFSNLKAVVLRMARKGTGGHERLRGNGSTSPSLQHAQRPGHGQLQKPSGI